MLIGIDFDNTIAGYARVFPAAAVAEGLLNEGEASSKHQVRDILRQRPNGEQDWMRLQGRVYGAHMGQAELITGVDKFLRHCKSANVPVRIISHKTEFGHFDPQQINLRQAARDWMRTKGFFANDGYGLAEDHIIFENTRAKKVARIASFNCTHFIDDLEEIFLEPGFPMSTKQYLFSPVAYKSWDEIFDAIFGD